MANSYIEYKGKEIRINDSVLSIICAIADDQCNSTLSYHKLIGKWKEESLIAPPGLINLDLSGYWETKEGVLTLSKILNITKNKVEQYDGFIPSSYLNRLAKEYPPWFTDVDTELVLKELQKWISMIEEV